MTDEGFRLDSHRQPALDLPKLRNLRIKRVPYRPRKLEHFVSRQAPEGEAIEFIVEVDGPVPVRAFGPALFVGDVEVHDSERLDDSTWRLVALEPSRLKRDAPITWGWMKDPPQARQRTEFRYRPDGDEAPSSSERGS